MARKRPPSATPSKSPRPATDDVVLLKDLAPRADVKGGGKLTFGQQPTGSPRPRRARG